MRVTRSLRLSVKKMLSSTKKTLLNLNGVPLDVVGCLMRQPFRALRFPFFGDLKKRNSEAFTLILSISKNACMMQANRIGDALSPC